MLIPAVQQVSLAVGVSKVRLPTPHSLVLLPERAMLGAEESTVAMVWLQVLVLPHWSVATQVRVATKVLPQVRLVTVLRMLIEAVPQVSLAVGVSKVRLPAPHALVLLPEQEMLGAPVSTVAMVWLQVLVLPHWSVATQVRVATKVLPQVRLVTVLRMLIAAVPQVSLAVGVSKVRLPTPHSLVLFPEQEMLGAEESTVAMVWLHLLVLPHWSVATQVRVATKVLPQVRLVTVLRILIPAVPQVSLAVGVSNVRVPTPHSLVLLPEQEMLGG